jgi:micrococcal nuclease
MFTYRAKVLRVVDGDTYDLLVDLGFSISHKIRVRLRGVDTPETFGPNSSEEGRMVSDYVRNLIEGKDVIVVTYRNAPNTFNRWEADVVVADTKLPLAEHLLAKNLARVWKNN